MISYRFRQPCSSLPLCMELIRIFSWRHIVAIEGFLVSFRLVSGIVVSLHWCLGDGVATLFEYNVRK